MMSSVVGLVVAILIFVVAGEICFAVFSLRFVCCCQNQTCWKICSWILQQTDFFHICQAFDDLCQDSSRGTLDGIPYFGYFYHFLHLFYHFFYHPYSLSF